jgi:hypothetical protein
MVLATSPSTKSLAPQYPYNIQKGKEKGAVNSRAAAHTRRVTVIMFAKFLLMESISLRSFECDLAADYAHT